MKKFFPIFSIFLLSLFSCEHPDVNTEEVKSKNVCSVDNPVEDLAWLQGEMQLLKQASLTEYVYVQQAELFDETIFIFGNCCPFCNTAIPVYNCQGEVICYLGDCDGLEDKIKNKKLIWKHEDSSCNL